ncbi:MAG TPA: Fur family transcriptional regulator [Candidatus Saccharimonadales bacterium]|nr:Fur family transcriptional regulator [Candidatus Saccharimonadales bacterium]
MKRDFLKTLANNSLRTTRPRIVIFEVFERAAKPLSTTEIIRQCPEVDKVSVYRTIALFLKLHIIESTAHGWKQHYELATPFRPHHHHLFCTRCKNIVEIHSDALEHVIHIIASERTFQPTGHTFEISGLCKSCQKLHAE